MTYIRITPENETLHRYFAERGEFIGREAGVITSVTDTHGIAELLRHSATEQARHIAYGDAIDGWDELDRREAMSKLRGTVRAFRSIGGDGAALTANDLLHDAARKYAEI